MKFGLKPIKDQRFLLLVASVVLALLATFLVRTYLQVELLKATGGAPVNVLVAAKDVTAGSTLKATDFTERMVPEAHVSSRDVRAEFANFLEGQKVEENVPRGQQFFWTDIAFADRASLAVLVPVNQRAVTIPVDSLNSFSGMIEPGNRIDIFTVQRGEGMSGQGSLQVVLQNVRVIAVGDRTRPESSLAPSAEASSSSSPASNITLALAPAEAGKLALAQDQGRLVLLLRNPSDIFVEAVPGINTADNATPASASRENVLAKDVKDFPAVFVGGEKERSGFYPGSEAINQQLREMDPSALRQTLLDMIQNQPMPPPNNDEKPTPNE